MFPLVPLIPRQCAIIACVVVAPLLVACRSVDDVGISVPPTAERSIDQSARVRMVRIPGHRPGGQGDPRRGAAANRARQARGTVDPVGSFDLSFTDDGKPMTGTMVVQGRPGSFTGHINAEARPEVRISTVTASGQLVTVTADVPNGVLLLRFRMTGDSLHGDWSLRNDGGRLVGVRQPETGKQP